MIWNQLHTFPGFLSSNRSYWLKKVYKKVFDKLKNEKKEWCHNTATPGIEIATKDTAEYSVEIMIDLHRCLINSWGGLVNLDTPFLKSWGDLRWFGLFTSIRLYKKLEVIWGGLVDPSRYPSIKKLRWFEVVWSGVSIPIPLLKSWGDLRWFGLAYPSRYPS